MISKLHVLELILVLSEILECEFTCYLASLYSTSNLIRPSNLLESSLDFQGRFSF